MILDSRAVFSNSNASRDIGGNCAAALEAEVLVVEISG